MTDEIPPGDSRRTVRATLKEAVANHDERPAPIVDVVDAGLVQHQPTAVFDAFAELIRDGEVYEPEPNRVALTHRPDDGGE
jgi:hypothetical protein